MHGVSWLYHEQVTLARLQVRSVYGIHGGGALWKCGDCEQEAARPVRKEE